MSARLKAVDPAPAFAANFGPNGALREKVGGEGRVHVDRALPFIVFHRADPREKISLAARVALSSPAYVIWPGPADDVAALVALDAVLDEAHRHFSRTLMVAVYDLPRPVLKAEDAPELPRFVVEIGASADRHAKTAARDLAAAMGAIEIDLRQCQTRMLPTWAAPRLIARLVDGRDDISLLSIGLPRIHEAPGGRASYPQVFHDLAIETFDALLKAACSFMTGARLSTPRHHRGLGRSTFIDAAKSVDAKLDRICRSFDFLLSVSPINTTQQLEQFRADRWDKQPAFRYRPLTVDPAEAKRALYRIDLKAVEDPVLETLFSEKRLEIDQQLTMLEARNSPRFRFASLMLYEPVDSALHDAATDILAANLTGPKLSKGRADCHAVARAARTMVARYAARDPAFDVAVTLRDDLAAGMMVSGCNLYVSTATEMPAGRVEPLLHHEVGVHLLTFVNGSKQGLTIFKRGLAGYEGIQEGLGVFAEWAVGGLTRARLRLLAARVLAVAAMADGADFVAVFRLLRDDHGFSAETAYLIAARVFRSGGLTKDAIYLRGFKNILDAVAVGEPLDFYWYGKIDRRHLAIVGELAERGILHKPTLMPEFFDDPLVATRIAAFRQRPSYAALL